MLIAPTCQPAFRMDDLNSAIDLFFLRSRFDDDDSFGGGLRRVRARNRAGEPHFDLGPLLEVAGLCVLAVRLLNLGFAGDTDNGLVLIWVLLLGSLSPQAAQQMEPLCWD